MLSEIESEMKEDHMTNKLVKVVSQGGMIEALESTGLIRKSVLLRKRTIQNLAAGLVDSR